MKTVVIIGGGLSGTLVAVQLLQQATGKPLKIQVIERRSEIGRGVAYSTPLDCHLLNVPVNGVSLKAENPEHFLQWLWQQGHTTANSLDFMPRRLFGAYVQDTLATAIAAAPHVHFEAIADDAVHLSPGGVQDSPAQVYLRSGRTLQADRVVLALGNPAPGQVAIADPAFYQNSRYIPSGWSGQIEELLKYPSLLLIGAGLTAVDWIVALHDRQYSGQIHALSRHGLLPQPHHLTPNYPAHWQIADLPKTARGLLHWTRQTVIQAQAQGYDWRSVLDSLRYQTQALWVALPLKEKQRFTRHLRPYWDSHRHRIAPEIGRIVQSLQATRQLQVHTAHLQALTTTPAGVEVSLRPRGQTKLKTLSVGAVINCTGPQFNYRKLPDPLIQSLLAQGLMQPDPLSLGMVAAGNGSVITEAGTPSPWLYTLGPTRRGELWETIAVTEIRDQAISLSQTLLATEAVVSV